MRNDKLVEICHFIVFPDECSRPVRTNGFAYHLASIVHPQAEANEISREGPQILRDTAFFGPQESVKIRRAIVVSGKIGKAGNLTSIINRDGGVPGYASEVAKVGDAAVFPKHGVPGAESSHCLVTQTRDANYLASVIDCDGSAIWIAGEGFISLAGGFTIGNNANGSFSQTGNIYQVFDSLSRIAAVML